MGVDVDGTNSMELALIAFFGVETVTISSFSSVTDVDGTNSMELALIAFFGVETVTINSFSSVSFSSVADVKFALIVFYYLYSFFFCLVSVDSTLIATP